ncbi:MAG: hypothetical protein GXP09_06415 [Gammaproteobacteria bacterium]|nr:hypothetical protein [Gammaproteobacteria bacterium]
MDNKNRKDLAHIGDICDDLFIWCKHRRFIGYNKHDGLNSPILNALFGWGVWPRMVAIQGVMRFPINLRPLLLVKKTHNPKGLGLLVLGLLDCYRATSVKYYLSEAEKILEFLVKNRSKGNWSGACWGYQYPWQDPAFFAPAACPNAVVTSFVCEAFLDAFRVTKNEKYLDVVSSSIRFLLNDLPVLKESSDELCFGYMPLLMDMRVMDVSVLIAAVIAQYASISGNSDDLSSSERMINYVVRRQTKQGAWYYTDPPERSHIRHDNYHTGFILDAIKRYMDATECYIYRENYEKGLSFYANRLFNSNGSPRWMSDRDYPHDIHGAAQGILTFSHNHKMFPGLAEHIANWSLETMYNSKGRFYYQENRFTKKRFTLMRWCNAWMFRALASLYRYHSIK